MQAVAAQQVQTITQTEGGAFNGRPAQVGLVKIGQGQALNTAGGAGQGGHPFAVEKRQHADAFSANRRLAGQLIEIIQGQTQHLAYGAGDIGQVEGANQRQPAAAGRQKLATAASGRACGCGSKA